MVRNICGSKSLLTEMEDAGPLLKHGIVSKQVCMKPCVKADTNPVNVHAKRTAKKHRIPE